MEKSQLKYSQIVKLCIMAVLLLITPLLSTSMRPPYIYFLLNLLIIVVGAESGLLSSFNPPEDKKHHPVLVVAPPSKPISTTNTTIITTTTPLVESASLNKESRHDAVMVINNNNKMMVPAELGHEGTTEKKVMRRTVEKCVSQKTPRVVKVCKLKKSPSTPSLFFIGCGDTDHHQAEDRAQLVDEFVEEVEEEEVEDLSGQELFTKAEMFIGNFYKQLKIQREDSWKRLHDFYNKAF